jgi:AcrR family transcriptional regulator
MTRQATGAGIAGRRPNRRGNATRESMLEAALRSLASGEPGSVSANRIAKDIGATWGAVQYQFGDTDGFWAAVLHRTADRRAATFSTLSTPLQPDAPLRERVGAIVETLYHGLASADSRAIENLRAALPRDPDELERLYPRTST